MKRNIGPVALSLAALVTLTACHHRVAPAIAPSPTASAPTPVTRPPAPPPAARAASPAAPALTEDEIFRRKSLDQLNAEQPLGDVFFDYNQSDLRADARSVLARDAAWMAKWPQTHVSVDGHCDERGTEEYNLALGERRAEVVKGYLVSLGVSPERLNTRSFGKDAPFCQDGGESCWAQNRRDHFLITAK